MNNTRQLVSRVLDEIDTLETDYLDKIYLLEDIKQEGEYLNKISNDSLNSIDELLRFYSELKTNIDKNNFKKFVMNILKDDEETSLLISEMENLRLLTSTGLLKYAKEQQSFSKNIIINFLNKLSESEIHYDFDTTNIGSLNKKLEELKKFRLYFSPIGIIKEVKSVKEFASSLNDLKLSDIDKSKILLMALDFNVSYHDNELKKYELNLPLNKNLVKKAVFIEEDFYNKLKELNSNNSIDDILKKCKISELNEEKEINIFEEVDQEKIRKANKVLKDNINKDPYDSFIKYYEVLLGKEKKIEKEDLDIIEKAKEILSKNIKQLNGLSKIINEDLEATLNVYRQDENLRELVYKTTENINRLISYEIKDVLEKASLSGEKDAKSIAKELKPAVEYIEMCTKKKKRSRW